EELGGMNVFFVTNANKLITPKLTGTILEGITRDSILKLRTEQGLDVEERHITFDEWTDGVATGQIDEVLACGTAAVITPIGRVPDDGDTHQTGSTDLRVADAPRSRLLRIQTGAAEDTSGRVDRLA